MKKAILVIVSLSTAGMFAGSAAAQAAMSPPVTMQPIPNPPEKARHHGPKGKLCNNPTCWEANKKAGAAHPAKTMPAKPA
jgi:hypothetical protein